MKYSGEVPGGGGETENAMVSNTIVCKDLWVRFPPAAPLSGATRPVCCVSPAYALDCIDARALDSSYVYLLGLYLGDGTLSRQPNGVWKLRIFQDQRYTQLIAWCDDAMREVTAGNRVTHVQKDGCIEIVSYWKHWLCAFPQHAPGPKHRREIVLADWQQRLVESHPRELIRGLIHSDGCRALNWTISPAGKRYEYPRYHFSNRSDEIRELFVWACGLIGVDCRPNNRWNISVARRASVAVLDEFIGPKS